MKFEDLLSVLTVGAMFSLTLLFPSQAFAADVSVDPGVDDLEAIVEAASFGDTITLLQGVHVVDDVIDVPSGVTITADPNADPGSVVVQGGNNSTRANVFETLAATEVTIRGIRFVPAADADLGGRAVWLAFGGGDLHFEGNIVEGFTDGLYAFRPSSGAIEFTGNELYLVDRDPDSNNGFLGGNAGLTVLFAELTSLEASENTMFGPGRNVERFIGLAGIIIFNTTHKIENVDIWNNAIKGTDYAIFTSGLVGADGVVIALNRLESNGVGVAAGQVPDPDITIPTPAYGTAIQQNQITGNDYGIIIASNAEATTIEGNQISGNRFAQIFDGAAAGETTIGDNLIRGRNANGTPDLPPGQAFDPVTGETGS